MTTSYAADYNTCLAQAKKYQQTQARPQLATELDNIKKYDIIVLMSPN